MTLIQMKEILISVVNNKFNGVFIITDEKEFKEIKNIFLKHKNKIIANYFKYENLVIAFKTSTSFDDDSFDDAFKSIGFWYNDVRQSITYLVSFIMDLENSKDTDKFNYPKSTELKVNISKEIMDEVQKYLVGNHYSVAVEEAYKVVRKFLKDKFDTEKATDAFSEKNNDKFLEPAENLSYRDYIAGIKFLNMAIQNFRNSKAHEFHRNSNDENMNESIMQIVLTDLALKLLKIIVK